MIGLKNKLCIILTVQEYRSDAEQAARSFLEYFVDT